MAGTALRFALAFGLHTRSQCSLADSTRNKVLAETWWSLYHLSSMTGIPSTLRSDESTTPFPSSLAGIRHPKQPVRTPTTSFSDTQVQIMAITQTILSKLYIERRVTRSWSQIHNIMASMISELDEWALEAIPPYNDNLKAIAEFEEHQLLLRKQYCRTKILITRPSLHRIERCAEAGTQNLTAFDHEAAEACIQTAQDTIGLLPKEINLTTLYEKGPWWAVMHNSESFPNVSSEFRN
jgi:hypothetical protein